MIWQDNKEAKTIKRNWEDAKKYCRDLEFAGIDAWRLPSLIELKDAYRDRKKFKNYNSWYWSSKEKDSSGAWFVGFDDGYDFYYNKSDGLFVRCVVGRQ